MSLGRERITGCDFGGLFFFSCLLVVMRLWLWVCDFGGWGLSLWEVVAVAIVVAVVAARWCFFFFFLCMCLVVVAGNG